MSGCFADTYFFLALLFEKDEAQAQAQAWVAKLAGRLYTSLWVLTEVADAPAVPGRRGQFPPLLQLLRAKPLSDHRAGRTEPVRPRCKAVRATGRPELVSY
jgi:predicted nucleic acid-binding protein